MLFEIPSKFSKYFKCKVCFNYTVYYNAFEEGTFE